MAGQYLANNLEQHQQRRRSAICALAFQPWRHDRLLQPEQCRQRRSAGPKHPLAALRRSLLHPKHQSSHRGRYVCRRLSLLAARYHFEHAQLQRHRQQRCRRSQSFHADGRPVDAAWLLVARTRPGSRNYAAVQYRPFDIHSRFLESHLRGDGIPPHGLYRAKLRELHQFHRALRILQFVARTLAAGQRRAVCRQCADG